MEEQFINKVIELIYKNGKNNKDDILSDDILMTFDIENKIEIINKELNKKQKNDRSNFFRRLNELIHHHNKTDIDEILNDEIIVSLQIQDQEWCHQMIKNQLDKKLKHIPNNNPICVDETPTNIENQIDEDDVPACEENEILLDTPHLNSQNIFLFHKRNPNSSHIITRMVTPNFTLLY
jgi:hypothetical protein